MNLTTLITGLALCCLACVSNEDSSLPPDPVVKVDTTQGASFLSLGDSYTIGESVPEADRWSVQLAALLRKDGIAVNPPDIIARTGWTTAELTDGIKEARKKKDYKLVSLLIGVNNQYRGQSIDRYRAEFRSLLETSVAYAGGVKSGFLCCLPPIGAYRLSERRVTVPR